jgi:hypothetical protein
MTDADRALLERMRDIRASLEEDDSPYRSIRIKQADRRIAKLEAELGEGPQDADESADGAG